MSATSAAESALEHLITRDEGKRGLAPLIQAAQGALGAASARLCALPAHSSVAVLTGFPCRIELPVAQESDGPSGAVAIARALLALGHEVCILTDRCCEGVVRAVVDGAPSAHRPSVRAFAPAAERGAEAWDALLGEELAEFAALVAIERAGAAADGSYRTMSKRVMADLAPLDRLFTLAADRGVPTIAVGDGGNELGMGSLGDLTREHIPNGEVIACVTKADILIVASVSNWGGYALAGAIAARAADAGQFDSRLAALTACVATVDEEAAMLDAGVAAGMCDGVTGLQERTVDGLPFAETARVLEGVREVITLSNP